MEAFCRYLDPGPDGQKTDFNSEAFQYHRMEMYADAGTVTERKLITLESLGTEIAE